MSAAAESLTLAVCQPRVGQCFVLQAAAFGPDGGLAVDAQSATTMVKLVEAEPMAQASAGGRAAFALLFEGDAAAALPQGLYQAAAQQGDAAEPWSVFLVPVGRSADTVQYESVFA
jgi:hypothetical protein